MRGQISSGTELKKALRMRSTHRQDSIAAEIRREKKHPRPRECRTPQEPERIEEPVRENDRLQMPKKPEDTADKLTKYMYQIAMENWCRALFGKPAIQYGQYTVLPDKEKIFKDGSEEYWKKLTKGTEE